MTPHDKPRRRKLSAEEHALWRGVTRSISPLKRRRLQADAATDTETAATDRKPAASPPRSASKLPRAAPKPPRAAPAKEPPLAPLDRRSRQRLARGAIAIDARIDLHGRTQAEAHDALLRFLRRAQDKGAKVVLVITGKGGGALGAGNGVLKRQVPLWLALPEFRSYVLGVDAASAAHGGEGALYVRLRRGR